MMLKIAVVTGTRAEYGLLYCIMHALKRDESCQLQVIVTAMHLSPEFGLTYRLIEEDGFKIDGKVEMLLSSDTPSGIAKSIGLGVIGFSETLSELQPDLIIILGDRFELLAVAQAALVHKIPVAHIHGGELSQGAIDDAIRHSLTKMSHLHFVAAESYRKRVIQLGENPAAVFNVGAPGLERIKKTERLTRAQLEEKLEFKLGELNFLVTYHPATLDINETMTTLTALLEALDHFPEAKVIFTKTNADEAGRRINAKIDEYVAKRPKDTVAYISLGQVKYLSLLPFVDAVIGNSSSGIIEVPYFRKPTINIGNRQTNRLTAATVLNCDGDRLAIIESIQKALSLEFKSILAKAELCYSEDDTSSKIIEIIKRTNLKVLIKKQFYDLETSTI